MRYLAPFPVSSFGRKTYKKMPHSCSFPLKKFPGPLSLEIRLWWDRYGPFCSIVARPLSPSIRKGLNFCLGLVKPFLPRSSPSICKFSPCMIHWKNTLIGKELPSLCLPNVTSPREASPGPAGLCPSPDPGQPPAATVQPGRYLGGGPLHRGRRAGRGGVLLHFDDLFDLHSPGAVHGQQRLFFHSIRPPGPRPAAKWDFSVLSAHRRADAPAQPHRLSGPGRDSGPPADPTGYFGSDKGIPAVDLRRHGRHLSVQFFANLLRSVGDSATPLVFWGFPWF